MAGVKKAIDDADDAFKDRNKTAQHDTKIHRYFARESMNRKLHQFPHENSARLNIKVPQYLDSV